MNFSSSAIVALMLIDLMQPIVTAPVSSSETRHFDSGSGTLTVVTDTQGTLGSIPQGATRLPFLTVSMSASCDADIRVMSVDLKHEGLGNSQDLASVYAVEGFSRISRVARFDANRSALTLRFRSLVLPKCGAMTFVVYADMKTDASVAAEHSIVLSDPSAILSTARRLTVSEGDATKLVIAPQGSAGSLTVRMLPVNPKVSYGRIETVARIQLTAGSRTSQLLKRITFTNEATARDMDLQWLSLEMLSGTVLTAPLPHMRGYKATLVFDPTFVLHAGQTIVLNLKAEVRGSQSKKIQFGIEEQSDIVASPYRER